MKAMILALVCVACVAAGPATKQAMIPPAVPAGAVAEDPAERLKQMQAQREADRAKPADITVGELEDLMAELRRLRAMVAGAGAGKAHAPRKRYTMIEIGMTRDEVLAFVKQRPNELALTGMNTHAAGEQVSKVRERITRVTDRSDQPSPVMADQDELRERAVINDKRETIVISQMVPVYDTIDVGSGGRREMRKVRRGFRPSGRSYTVTLVNDVVTAVRVG